MAPLAAIDMPHQPFLYPAVRFGCKASFDHSGSSIDLVCLHSPLTSQTKKRKTQTQTRKRRVSFADTVDARLIPHLNDLSDDDILATWWTPNDYMVIRKMIALTIRMIMTGSKFDADDEDFCGRGLEIRTKDRSKERNLVKEEATEAVLRAQAYQRQEGFSDLEHIAQIYSEYTRESREESRSNGLLDMKAAR